MGAYLYDIYTLQYRAACCIYMIQYSTTKIGHDHEAKTKYAIMFIQYIVTPS